MLFVLTVCNWVLNPSEIISLHCSSSVNLLVPTCECTNLSYFLTTFVISVWVYKVFQMVPFLEQQLTWYSLVNLWNIKLKQSFSYQKRRKKVVFSTLILWFLKMRWFIVTEETDLQAYTNYFWFFQIKFCG